MRMIVDIRALLVSRAVEYKNDFTETELEQLGDFLDSVSRRIFRKENLEKTIARRNKDANKNEQGGSKRGLH